MDVIADTIHDLSKDPRRNRILCGGQGCISTIGGSVGKNVVKYYSTAANAGRENDYNRTLFDALGPTLIDTFTMLTHGSVKRPFDLCRRRTSNPKNLQMLENIRTRQMMHSPRHMASSDAYVDDKGNMCTLEYKLANTDLKHFFGNCELCRSENEVVRVLCDMLFKINDKFLRIMHSKGLFHMDIKTENLVLLVDKMSNVQMRVIDFGLMLNIDKQFDEFPVRGTHITMSPLSNIQSLMYQDTGLTWANISKEKIRYALDAFWGHVDETSKYELIVRLWGDEDDYLNMLLEQARKVPRVLLAHKRQIRRPMMTLLRKCDDYGVVLTAIELFPSIIKNEDYVLRLKNMISYRPNRMKSNNRPS